ncbi:MAG: hypothetical protein WC415_05565 [Patescibacteria group bacterium]|jgi:hypothetical protein
MRKIEPTTFNITKEEIEDMIDEMIQEKLLRDKTKLSRKQIVEVLSYVECDEFLAKDIRNSIRNSIQGVLNH